MTIVENIPELISDEDSYFLIKFKFWSLFVLLAGFLIGMPILYLASFVGRFQILSEDDMLAVAVLIVALPILYFVRRTNPQLANRVSVEGLKLIVKKGDSESIFFVKDILDLEPEVLCRRPVVKIVMRDPVKFGESLRFAAKCEKKFGGLIFDNLAIKILRKKMNADT